MRVFLRGKVEPESIIGFFKLLGGKVASDIATVRITDLHDHFEMERVNPKKVVVFNRGISGSRWYQKTGWIEVRNLTEEGHPIVINYRYDNIDYIGAEDPKIGGIERTEIRTETLVSENYLGKLVTHFGGWMVVGGKWEEYMAHKKPDGMIVRLNGCITPEVIREMMENELQVEVEQGDTHAIVHGINNFSKLRFINVNEGDAIPLDDVPVTVANYFHRPSICGTRYFQTIKSALRFQMPDVKPWDGKQDIQYAYSNIKRRLLPPSDELEMWKSETTDLVADASKEVVRVFNKLLERFGGWICRSTDTQKYEKVEKKTTPDTKENTGRRITIE